MVSGIQYYLSYAQIVDTRNKVFDIIKVLKFFPAMQIKKIRFAV